ncbi:hypothetical protein HanRHA438_Chr17g0827351 [Helianthus annuus]|nr:hypothetical protein HanRHA438_Chr17g0827351 [Helianthus annuus]
MMFVRCVETGLACLSTKRCDDIFGCIYKKSILRDNQRMSYMFVGLNKENICIFRGCQSLNLLSAKLINKRDHDLYIFLLY